MIEHVPDGCIEHAAHSASQSYLVCYAESGRTLTLTFPISFTDAVL